MPLTQGQTCTIKVRITNVYHQDRPVEHQSVMVSFPDGQSVITNPRNCTPVEDAGEGKAIMGPPENKAIMGPPENKALSVRRRK